MNTKTNLANVTVVMPTYERHDLLRVAVQAAARSFGRVIVLDGSAQPFEETNALPANATYMWRTSPIEDRLAFASSHIDTDYAMIQTDDDVFVPAAYEACLNKLLVRQDIIAVSPLAVQLARRRIKIAYPISVGWQNLSPDMKSRLLFLGRNYTLSTLFGICRTPEFVKSLGSIADNPIDVFAFWELHHQFVVNGLGRVVVLPQVGIVRRGAKPSVDRRARFASPFWFLEQGNMFRSGFIDSTANALAASDNTICEVRHYVSDAVDAYGGAFLKNDPSRSLFAGSRLRNLAASFPHAERLSKNIRRAIIAASRVPNSHSLRKARTLFADRGIFCLDEAVESSRQRYRAEQSGRSHAVVARN